MKKEKQKEFTVYVNRNVLFEAKIKADHIKDALEKAEAMSAAQLWDTTGDIIDDSHKVTGVFE